MLRLISILIILCALPKSLLSENLSQIDSLSIQTPAESARSIDHLVAYCESHAVSELARVRFYFVWIATHIDYDEEMRIDQQESNNVFTNQKALCSGYARLLAQLCSQSGIASRYVSGYGKDLDDGASIENHAWNVIRIDGVWQSFDVTWAANELADDLAKPFSPTFEAWFMPDSRVFQKTHLPYDPVFQLSIELLNRVCFFEKESKTACYTEGVIESTMPLNFTDILNEEATVDSLERTWRSFRRAFTFMPMDSAVAIKLAKVQEMKIKQVFEYVQQFSQNDYLNIENTSAATLKNWLEKLQALEKPIEEAVNLHTELATFPLSEANKQMLNHNHTYFEELQKLAKGAVKELISSIESKEITALNR